LRRWKAIRFTGQRLIACDTWDVLGNLASRTNKGARVLQAGQALAYNTRKEGFCYDALNRLVKTLPTDMPSCSGTSNPTTDDLVYDGFGNIKKKAGVGNYSYNRTQGGPHAVTQAGNTTYTYDKNGNMATEANSGSAQGDRRFDYTSYDLVSKITRSGSSDYVAFKYGPDRARWQRIDKKGTSEKTTTYLGNVERIEIAGVNEIEWKRHIGGVVITYSTTRDTGSQPLQVLKADKSYLYKDHLGSVDIITNGVGSPTYAMSFDPWGADGRLTATTYCPRRQLLPW
jgi:YD repeat-containing protein